MICTTIRKENECVFMTKNGCSYEGGVCKTIVERCEGCDRIIKLETGQFCMSSPEPSAKWKHGKCNLATHIKVEIIETKHKINPLKASKRGHR